MHRARGILAVAVLVAATSACAPSSTSAPPQTTGCRPPAGGRCAGPAPISTWLIGPLTLAADGRTVSGRFQCGGTLVATETSTRVTLTFVAGAVGAGALSCALVPLTVVLHTTLGNRIVVDGVTHQTVSIQHT